MVILKISGSGFDYGSALDTVQSGSYNTQADYDDIRIRQDFESYDFDLYDDFSIAQTNDDHNWNSNQKQKSQYDIYNGKVSNVYSSSNANKEQSHLNYHEDFDTSKFNEESSWNPIEEKINLNTIRNDKEDVSTVHQASNRNRRQIHPNDSNMQENETSLKNFHDSRAKIRVKRQTGTI